MDKVFPQNRAVSLRVPGHRIPCPEADEVMTISLKEVEISREIKGLRWIIFPHVYQVVPHMRTGQVDHIP
jgi:hypothetical protein